MLSIRPLSNLYNSLIITLSTFKSILRNNDIMHKSVFWSYKISKILVNTKSTNKLIFLSFKNFYYLCFLNMSLTTCHKAYFHAITIKCPHRVTLRNKYRRASIIWQERILTIWVLASVWISIAGVDSRWTGK